jgi:hypothetical protein
MRLGSERAPSAGCRRRSVATTRPSVCVVVTGASVVTGSARCHLHVRAEDEQEVRDFAAGDPVVTTGTAEFEVGRMLAGFVRPPADA